MGRVGEEQEGERREQGEEGDEGDEGEARDAVPHGHDVTVGCNSGTIDSDDERVFVTARIPDTSSEDSREDRGEDSENVF